MMSLLQTHMTKREDESLLLHTLSSKVDVHGQMLRAMESDVHDILYTPTSIICDPSSAPAQHTGGASSQEMRLMKEEICHAVQNVVVDVRNLLSYPGQVAQQHVNNVADKQEVSAVEMADIREEICRTVNSSCSELQEFVKSGFERLDDKMTSCQDSVTVKVESCHDKLTDKLAECDNRVTETLDQVKNCCEKVESTHSDVSVCRESVTQNKEQLLQCLDKVSQCHVQVERNHDKMDECRDKLSECHEKLVQSEKTVSSCSENISNCCEKIENQGQNSKSVQEDLNKILEVGLKEFKSSTKDDIQEFDKKISQTQTEIDLVKKEVSDLLAKNCEEVKSCIKCQFDSLDKKISLCDSNICDNISSVSGDICENIKANKSDLSLVLSQGFQSVAENNAQLTSNTDSLKGELCAAISSNIVLLKSQMSESLTKFDKTGSQVSSELAVVKDEVCENLRKSNFDLKSCIREGFGFLDGKGNQHNMDALTRLDKSEQSMNELVLSSRRILSNLDLLEKGTRAVDNSLNNYAHTLDKLEENQTLRTDLANSLRLLKENSEHQIQSLADVEENLANRLDKLRKTFAKQSNDLNEIKREMLGQSLDGGSGKTSVLRSPYLGQHMAESPNSCEVVSFTKDSYNPSMYKFDFVVQDFDTWVGRWDSQCSETWTLSEGMPQMRGEIGFWRGDTIRVYLSYRRAPGQVGPGPRCRLGVTLTAACQEEEGRDWEVRSREIELQDLRDDWEGWVVTDISCNALKRRRLVCRDSVVLRYEICVL